MILGRSHMLSLIEAKHLAPSRPSRRLTCRFFLDLSIWKRSIKAFTNLTAALFGTIKSGLFATAIHQNMTEMMPFDQHVNFKVVSLKIQLEHVSLCFVQDQHEVGKVFGVPVFDHEHLSWLLHVCFLLLSAEAHTFHVLKSMVNPAITSSMARGQRRGSGKGGRHQDGFVPRPDSKWPLRQTEWKKRMTLAFKVNINGLKTLYKEKTKNIGNKNNWQSTWNSPMFTRQQNPFQPSPKSINWSCWTDRKGSFRNFPCSTHAFSNSVEDFAA